MNDIATTYLPTSYLSTAKHGKIKVMCTRLLKFILFLWHLIEVYSLCTLTVIIRMTSKPPLPTHKCDRLSVVHFFLQFLACRFVLTGAITPAFLASAAGTLSSLQDKILDVCTCQTDSHFTSYLTQWSALFGPPPDPMPSKQSFWNQPGILEVRSTIQASLVDQSHADGILLGCSGATQW